MSPTGGHPAQRAFPAHPSIYEINTWPWLWVSEYPERFVQGSQTDLREARGAFIEVSGRVLANGRDPYTGAWPERAGERPADDYWPHVIGAVRQAHPGFLFLAEAYWDLEWALQSQGFDFCYDKRLYDRLVHTGAGPDLDGRRVRLADPTNDVTYVRDGADVWGGLYVELAAWGWHPFRVEMEDDS
jgi:hypothetical protein